MLTLTQARTLSISGAVLPAYFSERGRGKTTRCSVATWQAPIGMKLLGTAFKSMLLTSAAMLVTLPMPTLSRAETQTVQQSSVPAGRVSEMGESPAKKQMDASQQEQLLRIFGIGLQWASGEISFDEVTRSLGAPSRYDATAWDAGADKSEYSYFLDGMTVDFIYDKARLVDGKPAVNELRIDVDEHVQTNIPKEVFETRFSLHRRVVGESIDGVRTETSPYFLPSGIVAADNPNRARFGYRQLLPPDSPYDVHVGMDYLGKFENDGPEFRSLKNSVNLRAIQINRVYLTPKELQQREQAKRQTYGEMNLRTGMPCPETGVRQGFAENCTPDVAEVDEQRTFVLRLLATAIMILRDDKPFDRSDVVFGKIYDTEPHSEAEGSHYRYATGSTLPTTRIDVDTVDDPEDYSDDRKKVKIVPIGVSIDIGPMLPGVPHTEIENLLHLDNYWIDADNKRVFGNEIPGRYPDTPNLQVFRYRTKSVPGSRFPVDVELFYANPVDGSSPPKLAEVRMMRAYKVLTPEERAQRRREQQQAKRQKYGEMNLCTGMLCPETGMWQGFSESNAADVTVVWKGRKFPSVRTLTHQEEREQRRSTTWVDGQWMWLREFDDSNPHVNNKGI